jgi:hypothetical protein
MVPVTAEADGIAAGTVHDYHLLYMNSRQEMQSAINKMNAWCAANPHITGRAEVSEMAGFLAAWLKDPAHPAN